MLAPLITLLASVVIAAPIEPEVLSEDAGVNSKYWSLSAKKVVQSLGTLTHLEKRDDGYVSLSLENEQTFYMATVELGSNDQKVGVLLDTGSSDFWVVGSNNSYCESGTTGSLSSKGRSFESIVGEEYLNKTEKDISPDKAVNIKAVASSSSQIDCSQYGTFSESSSSSFSANNTEFAISYADQSFAKGYWGQDSLTFGGVTIKNMNLAVCDDTDNAQGVLGIGLAGLEVTYSSNTDGDSYTYENLPLKLVADGIINKAAYSVYLNSADDAEILFGGVDTSKYSGDLVQVPIVNALYDMRYSSPIQLTITVNELSFIETNSSSAATIGSGAMAALLDTGTTLTYMPSTLVDSILSLLDFQYSSSLGYYIGDCSIGEVSSIRFNFQGFDIDIPLSSFFISLYTSSNVLSNQCAFGILSSGSDAYMTLGDSFLSNIYMVADLENLNIALGMMQNSTSSSIKVIEDSIPEAITATGSTTYGSKYNSFTIASSPTLKSTNISTTSISAASSASASSSSSSSNTSNTAKTTKTTKTANTANTTSTNASGTSAFATASTSSSVSSISTSKNKNGAVKMSASPNFGLLMLLFALF